MGIYTATYAKLYEYSGLGKLGLYSSHLDTVLISPRRRLFIEIVVKRQDDFCVGVDVQREEGP